MSDRIERHDSFPSTRVPARTVDIRLPRGYDDDTRRYPVLYMHDGQNLFEADRSFTGVPWDAGRTLDRLAREEGLCEAVIVGIWNTGDRIPEYMPQRPMEELASDAVRTRFSDTYGDDPCSDAYLAFIVDELKPFVDARYRTLTGVRDTVVMGSSMGGLVSLYALCEYPEVFGAAGCLSTSWTVIGSIMPEYLGRKLPAPGRHRLYFDYGVEAQIARYESLQRSADRVIRTAGYRRGVDWITRRFSGAPHSEAAWRERLDVPLRFLFSREARARS